MGSVRSDTTHFCYDRSTHVTPTILRHYGTCNHEIFALVIDMYFIGKETEFPADQKYFVRINVMVEIPREKISTQHQ